MTIFGPDGSHHQAGIQISDGDLARIGFMLWRASIGTKIDRTFANLAKLAEVRKVPFAAYHFVYQTETYAGSSGKAHPAEYQADTMVTALGGRADIPVMLDWESDGAQKPRWSDVLAVAKAMRAKGLNVTLLYTGKWYWSAMGRPDLRSAECALINAHYGKNQQGNADVVYRAAGGNNHPGWGSYGNMTPTILQYGSRIAWGDRLMDMNAYRENQGRPLSDLFQTWSPNPVPKPQPPLDWVSRGAVMTTPDAKYPLSYGDVHQNVPWLQAVLCSMPQDDGPNKGDPIFNPQWVGFDSRGAGMTTYPNLFGLATLNAFNYWLVRNGLPTSPPGGYPNEEAEAAAWAKAMQTMKAVRKR